MNKMKFMCQFAVLITACALSYLAGVRRAMTAKDSIVIEVRGTDGRILSVRNATGYTFTNIQSTSSAPGRFEISFVNLNATR